MINFVFLRALFSSSFLSSLQAAREQADESRHHNILDHLHGSQYKRVHVPDVEHTFIREIETLSNDILELALGGVSVKHAPINHHHHYHHPHPPGSSNNNNSNNHSSSSASSSSSATHPNSSSSSSSASSSSSVPHPLLTSQHHQPSQFSATGQSSPERSTSPLTFLPEISAATNAAAQKRDQVSCFVFILLFHSSNNCF